NGKVDRKRLLEKDITDQDEVIKKTIKQARTETEKKLVEIWRNVLDVEDISIDDNFFELGGNSILIINLISVIEDQFNVKLDFKNFISNSTIEKLAPFIDVHEKAVNAENVYNNITVDKENENKEFDLTDVQMAYLMGRDTQFELGGTSTHAYLEIESQLDIERFNKSLQKVIDRQSMLRAVILPNGKQKVLEHVPPYKIQVEDISKLGVEARENKILEVRRKTSHHIFD
ncbi:phosphopantetheine-binding protein, partial [Bacillus vallismortis]|nr:phosphopantetheine-binding protein [Bacillus vallismortis]